MMHELGNNVWLGLLWAILALNLLTFILYGVDKWKARCGRWRISEATLLVLALAGGSVGAWCGMRLWHHKTQHLKFRYGLPLILALHLGLAVWLVVIKMRGA